MWTDSAIPTAAKAVLVSLLNAWPVKLLGALMLALFGPIQQAHIALFVLMGLDFMTGVTASMKERTLSSAIGRQHLVRKFIAYGGVLMAMYQLERAITGSPYAFAGDYSLAAVLLYLVGTETISVLENLERITGYKLKFLAPVAKSALRKGRRIDPDTPASPAAPPTPGDALKAGGDEP